MRFKGATVDRVLLLSLVFTACSTSVGTRVTTKDYPTLSREDGQTLEWRKQDGPDFEVFYGRPRSGEDSGVGLYFGHNPNFNPSDASTVVGGRLGAFDVDWYQTSTSKPRRVYRTALLGYKTRIIKLSQLNREVRDTEMIHVWVYGPGLAEVERLTEFLSGLRKFHVKPEVTFETHE